MFSVHSVSKRLQRLIALIGLCAYLFLGVSSPEAFSVFLLQLEGPHEISLSRDVHGHEALVFHHHRLSTTQSDAAFHHAHPVEPDHIFLLPSTVDQGLVLSSAQSLEFQPPITQKLRLESTYLSLKPSDRLDPQKLAQPPPQTPDAHRPDIVEIRRTTVLII